DPNYLLSGHWLFPFYSVKTSMTFDETEDSVMDDKPLEANASDVAASDVKQDVETAKPEETAVSADTTETEETTETTEKETPQRPIKNYASKTTLGAGLVYYNSLTDGVRKQFILSGIVSTKSQDPLMFGSKSAFFGLYGKENRSWKTKKRFSPFYSKTISEDNTSESSVLFGMFGTKETKEYRVKKIFFYPRVYPRTDLEELSEDEKEANTRMLKLQHLEYARQYAEMNYPEQAAVEFLLAEGEYYDDIQTMRLAADQFALLEPYKLEKLLKNVPPQLLASTPAFSPDTFITYYPDEVFAKGADLYHKILTIIETEAASQPDAQTNKYLSRQDFNSTALALALLCYKYEKFEQCFDIMKQRYEKTEALSDGIDLLHFYADYVTHHQRLSRHKPHHVLTDELRDKFPGEPILEFLYAKKELSPFKDAYLEDIGIPKLLDVLELHGENALQSPKDRRQVLHLPAWPEPFSHVDPTAIRPSQRFCEPRTTNSPSAT
ncbi:MAG: hypothetical protein IKX48_08460, partial [Victivallales bacterium]|nr:hypothetical protein [Victivallales bacterium]